MKFSQNFFENWRFWKNAILKIGHFGFFFSKKIFFAWSPWKSITNYVIEWMGLNFDVSSKFLAMRNIVLYSVCWHTKLTIHAVPLLRWGLVDQAGCGRLRMSLFLSNITVLASHNNTIISEGDLLHHLYPKLPSKMTSKLYKPKNLQLNIWFCFVNKQKELVCTKAITK